MTIKLSRYVAEAAGILAGNWPSLTVTAHARTVLVEAEPVQMDQLSRHLWALAQSPGMTGKQVHALQSVALEIMERVVEARGSRGVVW